MTGRTWFSLLYRADWTRLSLTAEVGVTRDRHLRTSSALGANMRAAANSRPVRVISRARIPPVRDLCSV